MRAMILCVFAVACGGNGGGDGSGNDITDQPLQGVIGGEDWTFAEGETSAFLSDDDGFFTSFYGTAGAGGCTGGGGSDFIASIPTAVGEYPFNFSQNATFVVGDNENLVTVDGVIRVDSITETAIEGGVYANFDDDNEIDGTFTVSICPDN